MGITDTYFRGFDMNYPDLWRYNEWKREFDAFVANHNLPNLETIRFSHDHMGNFGTAFAGVNTPEAQQADNDLPVAKLVEAVAHSPYANNTLIIITEDDTPGRSGPHGLAPRPGLRRRPVREEGRGGQRPLQPGQCAAHDRGPPRHAA